MLTFIRTLLFILAGCLVIFVGYSLFEDFEFGKIIMAIASIGLVMILIFLGANLKRFVFYADPEQEIIDGWWRK